MNKNIKVTSQELRQLLLHIKDSQPDTCIRYRLIGQLWQPNFMRVAMVTERGVILQNEKENRFYIIYNLNEVMQLELDQDLYHYEPHFHYYIEPSPSE